jgi:cobalt/nickel transport system permease protein
MHVPDGFLDAPTSLATGVAAAAAVGIALRKSRAELDDRTAPMAGLVATFVFAVQMVNFPVGLGTSGHLLGGALAAVLVGPWTGLLAVSVVLIVQALLLADGGITALGTNISLLAIVGVAVGWLVFRGLQKMLPKRLALVPVLAAVSALVSVPVAALVFVGLYAVGGTAPVPLDGLAAAMLGWHTLIGLGEAVITGLVVASVIAVRPDLVYGARPALRERALEIRTSTPEVTA